MKVFNSSPDLPAAWALHAFALSCWADESAAKTAPLNDKIRLATKNVLIFFPVNSIKVSAARVFYCVSYSLCSPTFHACQINATPRAAVYCLVSLYIVPIYLVQIYLNPASLAHLQAHLCSGTEASPEAIALSVDFLGFLTFAGLAEAFREAIAEADSGADELPAKAGAKDKAIINTATDLGILISLFNLKNGRQEKIRNEHMPYRKNKEFRSV
ncbi:hypothetical protein [Undibacterium sp. TC9W]|uniref:hypothetical protein n=1 Tax=Undibacterium sp. TC9W TaxID=3413053 RepID=UPI003BF04E67